jgi:hypothetical protein
MSIPDSENGWIELRPFFTREGEKKPDNAAVTERLSKLSQFYELDTRSYETLTEEELSLFQLQKAEFLSELPRIERAANKPHYNMVPSEGLSLYTPSPNFIAYRSITQGLDLLTQEALQTVQPDLALDYAELNLRWATVDQSGTLLHLMIKAAQLAIIHGTLDRAVMSDLFNETQLTRLSAMLRPSVPEHWEFAEAMKIETYLADLAITDIVAGKKTYDHISTESLVGMPQVMLMFADSDWESERKAYGNFQQAQASDWATLSNPQLNAVNDAKPMDITSSIMAPANGRALVHFAYIHSKLSSLIVMSELERYKLHNGEYPLDLVFVADVARDMMDTRPYPSKRLFRYEQTEGGYTLTSDSDWYKEIDHESPTVYGRGVFSKLCRESHSSVLE